MTTLLIKTKDKIYKSRQSLHCLVLLEYNIKPKDIIDKGFLTKDREVWIGQAIKKETS